MSRHTTRCQLARKSKEALSITMVTAHYYYHFFNPQYILPWIHYPHGSSKRLCPFLQPCSVVCATHYSQLVSETRYYLSSSEEKDPGRRWSEFRLSKFQHVLYFANGRMCCSEITRSRRPLINYSQTDSLHIAVSTQRKQPLWSRHCSWYCWTSSVHLIPLITRICCLCISKNSALKVLRRFESYLSAISEILHKLHQLVNWPVSYSAPQGSILVPLKFIIYTENVSKIVDRYAWKQHSFADDKNTYTRTGRQWQRSRPSSSMHQTLADGVKVNIYKYILTCKTSWMNLMFITPSTSPRQNWPSLSSSSTFTAPRPRPSLSHRPLSMISEFDSELSKKHINKVKSTASAQSNIVSSDKTSQDLTHSYCRRLHLQQLVSSRSIRNRWPLLCNE